MLGDDVLCGGVVHGLQTLACGHTDFDAFKMEGRRHWAESIYALPKLDPGYDYDTVERYVMQMRQTVAKPEPLDYRYINVTLKGSIVMFAENSDDDREGNLDDDHLADLRDARNAYVDDLCKQAYIVAGRGWGYLSYVVVVPNLQFFQETLAKVDLCLTYSVDYDGSYVCDVGSLTAEAAKAATPEHSKKKSGKRKRS